MIDRSTYVTGHYFKEGVDLDEQYRHIGAEAKQNIDRFRVGNAKIGLDIFGYGPEEDVSWSDASVRPNS